MQKKKFEIEYNLKSPSLNAIWTSIGTPAGLAEWFADDVQVNKNEFTFMWDNHPQKAKLINLKPYSHIRLQWEEDAGGKCFFELKLTINELTGDMVLHITDFALDSEKADSILLWDKQIELMRRRNGL